MWRREERLRYWLEGGGRSHGPIAGPGLKEKIFLKLQRPQSGAAVNEEPLSIRASVSSLEDELTAKSNVKDGLGILGQQPNAAGDFFCDSAYAAGPIREIDFAMKGNAVDLQLPSNENARIRQEILINGPIPRAISLNVRNASVGRLEPLYDQMPEVKAGKRFLIADPPIHILTSEISDLPHVRTSVRIDRLQDSERAGFLREAEVLRGIPGDRAELLAVFRHVPIEVISRLRFLTTRRAILYSISTDRRCASTRVHDIAAVRDAADQEIYLVPHRTQYRFVSLN